MQGTNMGVLIKELTRDEGMRKKPYHCTADKLTIGIGRNLDDVGISEEEAQFLLKNDIKRAVEDAKKFVWYDDLSPARKRVIINMLFNIGLGRFKQFKKTIQYISVGDYSSAAVEMLDSRWANQVGVRAKRLSKMMKEG